MNGSTDQEGCSWGRAKNKIKKKNTVNLCRIWGSHSSGYEELNLLEYNAV
jgi:hypothetical protein